MSVILATGGYDNTVRLWDASVGVCHKSFAHPEKQVNALAISSDKAFIVAGGNPLVRVYDVNARGGEAVELVPELLHRAPRAHSVIGKAADAPLFPVRALFLPGGCASAPSGAAVHPPPCPVFSCPRPPSLAVPRCFSSRYPSRLPSLASLPSLLPSIPHRPPYPASHHSSSFFQRSLPLPSVFNFPPAKCY